MKPSAQQKQTKGKPIRMGLSRGCVGIFTVFCLMGLTFYLAFAFPYSLFNLKQSETSEIKSVIIIGRNGEINPSPQSYFATANDLAPEDLGHLGAEQLTNTGKERMFLLGKFLNLRYYNLLLNGNPRMVQARSVDLDRALESAQSLLAGLNPPKERWLWSSTGSLMDWQPKAVHTANERDDDLLALEPNCFRLDEERAKWKNSSRYQQMLNEFRHDLQTLRLNTGLEFEDDLEVLSQIEESLKTRSAFRAGDVPSWYTPTLAHRLSHIADVTSESRFNSAEMQRLYVGRLLHEISGHINARIKLDQELRLAEEGVDLEQQSGALHPIKVKSSSLDAGGSLDQLPPETTTTTTSTTMAPVGVARGARLAALKRAQLANGQPKVFIYMTDKQRLAALMNSLQIYSSQPQFGSMLLIELHHDPINKLYFLRLFTLSSISANVFPEPLRVNPIACADSAECAPQQFEQNIRHLMLDRTSWLDMCNLQVIRPTTTAPVTTAASKMTSTPSALSSTGATPQVTTELVVTSGSSTLKPEVFESLPSTTTKETTTTSTTIRRDERMDEPVNSTTATSVTQQETTRQPASGDSKQEQNQAGDTNNKTTAD